MIEKIVDFFLIGLFVLWLLARFTYDIVKVVKWLFEEVDEETGKPIKKKR